ncbi:unnamed protein product [Caenorhabditis nigoni]
MDRHVDMSMFLLPFFRTVSWVNELITVDEKWVSCSNNLKKGQLIDKEELALDVSEPKFPVKWDECTIITATLYCS